MGPNSKSPATPPSVKNSSLSPLPTAADAGIPSINDNEEPKALSETKPAWAVLLVATGILMSLFLVALDRTILSTAVPEITNEFNSFDDFGWYGSAYLISCCALQLLFGKLFTFFSVKYTLFLSVLTFEVASAVCGAAPSSITFIIGRAIAGIGAAGIFAGAVGSIRLLPSGRCRSYWTRRCPTKNFERNQIRQIPYTEPSLGGLEVSYAHHRM